MLRLITGLLLVTFLLGGPRMVFADTAYVANEATGTVSVIDTKTNRITATIGLGSDPAVAGTPPRPT